MKKACLLLLVISFLSSGRTSVFLNDSKNICSETGGSLVLPGQVVTLFCGVENTGAPGGNLLIWNTPVSQIGDLIHTNGALYQSNSIFSSTASFNGNEADSTLTFTTIQSLDNKVMTCRDNLGNSKSCTLLIFTIPSAIRNLTNTSVTYQSVSLSWNAPSDTGGYNTVNYIITVTRLDDSDPWNIATTDNSTSYIVTGLMFGQSYNFTVRANNSIGLGEESNIIMVTMLRKEIPLPTTTEFIKNTKLTIATSSPLPTDISSYGVITSIGMRITAIMIALLIVIILCLMTYWYCIKSKVGYSNGLSNKISDICPKEDIPYSYKIIDKGNTFTSV